MWKNSLHYLNDSRFTKNDVHHKYISWIWARYGVTVYDVFKFQEQLLSRTLSDGWASERKLCFIVYET